MPTGLWPEDVLPRRCAPHCSSRTPGAGPALTSELLPGEPYGGRGWGEGGKHRGRPHAWPPQVAAGSASEGPRLPGTR